MYGSFAFVGGYQGVPQLFRAIGAPAPPSAGVHDGQGVEAPPASAVTFAVYSTPLLTNFIATGAWRSVSVPSPNRPALL